jgi:hypothetical protein
LPLFWPSSAVRPWVRGFPAIPRRGTIRIRGCQYLGFNRQRRAPCAICSVFIDIYKLYVAGFPLCALVTACCGCLETASYPPRAPHTLLTRSSHECPSPPAVASAQGPACSADIPTIGELAGSAPDLSTLVAAVKAANLTDVLSLPGPIDVFAPTNDAFGALLASLNISAETLLAETALLTNVLQYHVVVDGAVCSGALSGAVETAQGGALTSSPCGSSNRLTTRAGIPCFVRSTGTLAGRCGCTNLTLGANKTGRTWISYGSSSRGIDTGRNIAETSSCGT